LVFTEFFKSVPVLFQTDPVIEQFPSTKRLQKKNFNRDNESSIRKAIVGYLTYNRGIQPTIFSSLRREGLSRSTGSQLKIFRQGVRGRLKFFCRKSMAIEKFQSGAEVFPQKFWLENECDEKCNQIS